MKYCKEMWLDNEKQVFILFYFHNCNSIWAYIKLTIVICTYIELLAHKENILIFLKFFANIILVEVEF